MAKLPAIQLYPGDWLRDEVAGCSLGAQGLWLRMMFIAHDSEDYGYLVLKGEPMTDEFVARRASCSVTEYKILLEELMRAGVPSQTNNGVIYSRRMARDAKVRKRNNLRQKRFRKEKRSASSNAPRNGDVTHLSRRSSSSSSSSPSGINTPLPPAGGKQDLPPVPLSLQTPEFLKAWDEWIAHRKEIKHKLTPRAAAQQLRDCEEWGIERAIAAIRNSIGAGWQKLAEPFRTKQDEQPDDQIARIRAKFANERAKAGAQ